MNIKMIKVFKYSFAQLLLKYQSKYFAENDLYENVLRFEILKIKFKKLLKKKSVINDEKLIVNAIMSIEKSNFEEKLVRLNNIRDLTFDKKINMSENVTRKTTKNKSSSKSDNLIKLRRLKQNQQKSHKLKSKWKKFYIIQSIFTHKKNEWLKNLNIEEIKKWYHVNIIALFLSRRIYIDQIQSWKTVSEINFQIWADVRTWMKKRIVDRKAEMHSLNKDSYEEKFDINISDKVWWKTAFDFSSKEYEDETKWNY